MSVVKKLLFINSRLSHHAFSSFPEAQILFRQDGPKFIIKEQCFDALYSVLVNFATVDQDIKQRSWDLMLKGLYST